MKKIHYTSIVCALALFLLSISDVFPADMTKLPNKEFAVNGLAKKYDTTGAYFGSGQISQGIFVFGEPADGIIGIHNIASDLFFSLLGGWFELDSVIELGPYTTGANKIKSTTCTMTLYNAAGTEVGTFGPVTCDATIKFTSNTAFLGTITIPDVFGVGSSYLLTLNGKLAGKWSGSPFGTSLLGGLKNSAPEGLRKFLQK